MSAIARIAVSPRLSLAALRSIRPATVQVQLSCSLTTVSNPSEKLNLSVPSLVDWLWLWPNRPPTSSPPPHPSLTSTLQPSSSELVRKFSTISDWDSLASYSNMLVFNFLKLKLKLIFLIRCRHCWCGWVWCWNRLRLRLAHHRLRQVGLLFQTFV